MLMGLPNSIKASLIGVGDIRLIGKYRFYREDSPLGSNQMSVIGGLELPTGDTTKRKDGVKLPPSRQLGSGGVDPFFAFAAGWISGHHAIEGGAQVNGTGIVQRDITTTGNNHIIKVIGSV